MTDENRELPTRKRRYEAAVAKMAELVPKVGDEDAYRIAGEIGLFECVQYDPESLDQLEFDFTNLQAVAFAAALEAFVEYKEYRTERKRRKRAAR